MRFFQFDVVLAGLSEIDDDLADALFEAGCDDGTPCSSEGVAWIGFTRKRIARISYPFGRSRCSKGPLHRFEGTNRGGLANSIYDLI